MRLKNADMSMREREGFFPFPFYVFKKPGLGSVSLPKHKQTKHTHYSSWNNDKTLVLVAERIALFGFEFEQR